MQIIENKALLLRLKNPARVLAAVPDAKALDEHTVAVRWALPQAQALRKLSLPAPSPIEKNYGWPGRFRPMAHQRATAAFLTLHKRCFCFNEQGTGKSASAIWAADYLLSIGAVKRVLIVCPVSIMDAAWRSDLFSVAMHRTVDVAYGTAEKRRKVIANGAQFIIINYDGVGVVKKELVEGGFDLVIVDECFVAGTEVHTPEGPRKIETLVAGDRVLTSAGVRTIKATTKSVPTSLVEVRLKNGDVIRCTPEHPFFTDWGWVCARNLAGRRLISTHDLRYLRKRVPTKNVGVEFLEKAWHASRDDLLEILRSEEMACPTSGSISASKSHRKAEVGDFPAPKGGAEIRSNPTKTIRDSKDRWVSSGYARGQRAWAYDLREYTDADAAPQLGMELPSSVGGTAAGLSYKLQARLRMAKEKSRSGGERIIASDCAWPTAGCEENRQAAGAWVDSVVYLEPRSGEYVYNLEVDGTPNYFVGPGYLVHNCSHYSNKNTARWRALNAILQPETWLWMMTGTPAAQGPVQAYGLAKLVNPRGVPSTFTAFRDMVMYKITQFKWGVKDTAVDTVHNALQPAIRFSKMECLDLPEMVYVRRDVPMSKQQKFYYDKLRKQALLEASGESVTAANAAVVMNKLIQIACGSVYTDNQNTLEFDVSGRYSALLEVLQEAPRKVLVFVPFRHTIKLVAKNLRADRYTCELISGEVPASERTQIFHRFQTEPDPRVLIIQPQAAAHGVTLTAADTVVWWGPVPSLEIYAQANARVHRKGQTNRCTVFQLVGSPVEKRVYELLDNKIDIHTQIIKLYKNELDKQA